MYKNAIGDARTQCPDATNRKNTSERAISAFQAVKRIVSCVGKVVVHPVREDDTCSL